MAKITIKPDYRFFGQFYDKNNNPLGDIRLRGIELSLSDDNDGIDFFIRNDDSSNNDTDVFTVLSPDEADILADVLHRLAEQFRRIHPDEY